MMADSGQRFGWGRLTPSCLQVLNGPRFYVFSLSLLTIMKTFTTGYLAQNIPAIEKRFSMTSQDLGIITAANDIPGLILIGFVSYFGEHTNKIKWLGYGSLITGIGCLLSVLPHLIVGEYHPIVSTSANAASNQSAVGICVLTNATAGGSSGCVTQFDSEWYYMFIFIMSQILMGIGSTPLFSLGPAYLDENLHPRSVPVYIGVWYAATWLGPGLGFILGGYISTIYVDVTLPSGISLTPLSPQWIGAWWLGFLIVGILTLVFSLLILGFPRELPGAREMRDKAMADGILAKRDEDINGKLKELLPATVRLLRNATFMFNSLALTATILYIQGSSSFLAKIINLKFGVDYNTIGIALGSIFTPAGVVGILLGGLVCRFFNLKKSCKRAALMIVITHCVFIWVGFVWKVPGCEEVPIAGLTTPYSDSKTVNSSLLAKCNSNCACPKAFFNPVCGVDKLTYYSSCHAGCMGKEGAGMYKECQCVKPPPNVNATASPGYCDRGSGCSNYVWFMLIIGVNSVLIALISVPTRIVVLRCVPFNQRSYALGFQFVFTKLLGFIPSPVLFGVVVDKTCLLWSESCGQRGACSLYDIADLSNRLLAMVFICFGLSTIFYFLSYWFYKPEMEDKADLDEPGLLENNSKPKIEGKAIEPGNRYIGYENKALSRYSMYETGL